MTRLHKLLYLADLEHYLETGRTITDATWVREKYGPMTKAMLPSLGEMKGHETEDEKRQTNSGREVPRSAEGLLRGSSLSSARTRSKCSTHLGADVSTYR